MERHEVDAIETALRALLYKEGEIRVEGHRVRVRSGVYTLILATGIWERPYVERGGMCLSDAVLTLASAVEASRERIRQAQVRMAG